jgi:hypothetical protein
VIGALGGVDNVIGDVGRDQRLDLRIREGRAEVVKGVRTGWMELDLGGEAGRKRRGGVDDVVGNIGRY